MMAFGSRGVGYLKINSRLLPKREKGNMNEAFIVKQEPGPRNITLDSNPFPKESVLPGFKAQVMFMTKVILSLPEVPESDAADALAVAVCHSNFKLSTSIPGCKNK